MIFSLSACQQIVGNSADVAENQAEVLTQPLPSSNTSQLYSRFVPASESKSSLVVEDTEPSTSSRARLNKHIEAKFKTIVETENEDNEEVQLLPRGVGLLNIGNTCYFNALIQVCLTNALSW